MHGYAKVKARRASMFLTKDLPNQLTIMDMEEVGGSYKEQLQVVLAVLGWGPELSMQSSESRFCPLRAYL